MPGSMGDEGPPSGVRPSDRSPEASAALPGMRVLVVYQGPWGARILDHVRRTAPEEWQIDVWRGPAVLPLVIDDPTDFIPHTLSPADLLLVLTEHAGMTDLAPDLAQRCGAQAVILPVDRRSWAPSGLVRQVRDRLGSLGVALAAPMPFCSLTSAPRQHPLIRAFAERYGRPSVVCAVDDGHVVSCHVLCQTPCGNTLYIADRLPGVLVTKAPEQAGLLHHYYPCWGGMEADPVTGEHTLLHIAATLTQRSIMRALEHAREEAE